MDKYVDQIAAFMNEYPPLWIVYGFLLVLPFVMMAFCCVKPRVKDDSARRKKTDEPSPDDKSREKKGGKGSDVVLLPASSSASKTLPALSSKSPHSHGNARTSSSSLQPLLSSEPEDHLHRRSHATGGTGNQSGSRDPLKVGTPDVSKHTLVVSEREHSPHEIEEDEESRKADLKRSTARDMKEAKGLLETIRDENIAAMVAASKKEEEEEEELVVVPQGETAQETGTVVAGDEAVLPEREASDLLKESSEEEGLAQANQDTSNGHGEMQASGSVPTETAEHKGLVAGTRVDSNGQNHGDSEMPTAAESDQLKTKATRPAEDVSPVGDGEGAKTSSQFKLESFDLMECEADPTIVEQHLEDPRLKELCLKLEEGDSLGLSIVGGFKSAHGDLPIYIKKLTQSGVAWQQDKLAEGDQIVAVNDKLFIECTLEYAVQVLRNANNDVRILYLPEY